MKNKFWLILFAFLFGVIGCYTVVAIKNSGNTYVVDIDGNLKVYKPEIFAGRIPKIIASINKQTNDYYNENVKGKYCLAEMTMSGKWSDTCYDKKQECESELKYWKAQDIVLNSDKCYTVKIVDAWCLYYVRSGYYNYSKDGSVTEVYEHICTKNKSLCEQLEYAQHPLVKTGCISGRALSHESFAPYVWKDEDIKEIIEKTKNLPPLIFGK